MGANVVKTTTKLEICSKFFALVLSQIVVFKFHKKVSLTVVKDMLEFHIFVRVLR
ncbi:MAG: hypothetical protein ACI9WT_000116 [Flavobacterium sp.]|jgi:hypothetical protein